MSAVNYIATWFYKESEDEASFYPQMGKKGSSPLVHSVYMKIQVPFFVTFKHYNPEAKFLFFTNLKRELLPDYLLEMFDGLDIAVITLPYTKRPPKDWYKAWQNQFYLYDMLEYMEKKMNADDCLLVSDADCVCRSSLDTLFTSVRTEGTAFYETITDRTYNINGITLPEMEDFYVRCFGKAPVTPMTYYGGEFIALSGKVIKEVNAAYDQVWSFNLKNRDSGLPKLNEEAHVMSIIAERIGKRNDIANAYVKRMWTTPQFNNVRPGDENLPVWHLPYEKKRGLSYLYSLLRKTYSIENEELFWKKAGYRSGVPVVYIGKRVIDRWNTLWTKLKYLR